MQPHPQSSLAEQLNVIVEQRDVGTVPDSKAFPSTLSSCVAGLRLVGIVPVKRL